MAPTAKVKLLKSKRLFKSVSRFVVSADNDQTQSCRKPTIAQAWTFSSPSFKTSFSFVMSCSFRHYAYTWREKRNCWPWLPGAIIFSQLVEAVHAGRLEHAAACAFQVFLTPKSLIRFAQRKIFRRFGLLCNILLCSAWRSRSSVS